MNDNKVTPDLEKPDFSDPLFIKKMSNASPIVDHVAQIYAYTNYSHPVDSHSVEVAKYSFIRGYNFANHALQKELLELKAENQRIQNDLLDALDLKHGDGPTALSMVVKERDELRQWKQSAINVWGPLIDYVQENPPADLKIGESISKYILKKLKL